jgi:hypothetical protein
MYGVSRACLLHTQRRKGLSQESQRVSDRGEREQGAGRWWLNVPVSVVGEVSGHLTRNVRENAGDDVILTRNPEPSGV